VTTDPTTSSTTEPADPAMSSIAVLEPPAPPEPKPPWQCRAAECSQPVFGNLAFCTACSILFGPYDVLLANSSVQEWEPDPDAG